MQGLKRKLALVGLVPALLVMTSCSSPHSATASKKELHFVEKKFTYMNSHLCGYIGNAAAARAFATALTYHSWQTQDETSLARSIAYDAYSEGRSNCSEQSTLNSLFINEEALDHDLGGKP